MPRPKVRTKGLKVSTNPSKKAPFGLATPLNLANFPSTLSKKYPTM